MPTIAVAIEVQVPDRSAASFDAPVLPIAAVVPPAALDAPLADHIDDLVAPASPLEHRGQSPVAFDPDLLVVPLRHGHAAPGSNAVNRTHVRVWRATLTPGSDIRQGGHRPHRRMFRL